MTEFHTCGRKTNIMEDVAGEFLSRVSAAEMVAWSDDKKGEFCSTFEARVRASRTIIRMTALRVLETAESRRFISQRHLRKYRSSRDHGLNNAFGTYHLMDARGHNGYANTVGGRSIESLADIAQARAKEILDQLPALATVVSVIDPATSAKIRRKEKLQEDCTALAEEIAEVCQPISMSEMAEESPKMTLVQFLQLVNDREEKRQSIEKKLLKYVTEGKMLEEVIAKALYKGIPGLSEAIIQAVDDLMAQDDSLDIMSRRVTEKVKFGDSDAALGILQHFEADEVQVKSEIKDKFQKAIDSLNLPKAKRAKKVS